MKRFYSYKYIHLLLFLGMVISVLSCSQRAEPGSHDKGNIIDHAELPGFDSVKTEQVFVYNCGDTLQFAAHVTRDSTWLFLPDTSLKVWPVKAGSGARYEGASYLYWSKSDEAILQKPQGSFMTCQTVPKERSWAAAKLRGVDFRALGQEPGWIVELEKENQLKYVGNYGKDTLVVESPKPETDHKDRRVYHFNDAERVFELVIADTPCTDSMSGFAFPQTVNITVDGNTYSGCGRYLQ